MTSFIQGIQTVGISGGNFRQTSHNEQHDHQTRVFQEDKTVILGNIYGYTHTATSDDGPIIAYSHTTNITRPQSDDDKVMVQVTVQGQVYQVGGQVQVQVLFRTGWANGLDLETFCAEPTCIYIRL